MYTVVYLCRLDWNNTIKSLPKYVEYVTKYVTLIIEYMKKKMISHFMCLLNTYCLQKNLKSNIFLGVHVL